MSKHDYLSAIVHYWTLALLIVIFDWHGLQIISAAVGATLGVLLVWWFYERRKPAHA